MWVFGAPSCGAGVFSGFVFLLIFFTWIWWCFSPVHGKVYHLDMAAFSLWWLFFRLQVFSPGCGCLAPLSVVWVFLKAFSVVDISFMNLMVLLTRSWKGISLRYWRHFLFEFFFPGYFSPWVWVFGAPSCGVGIFDVFLLFFLRKWCSSPVHKKGISRRYGGFLEAVNNCWALKNEDWSGEEKIFKIWRTRATTGWRNRTSWHFVIVNYIMNICIYTGT